jgi:transposase-like protein
MACTKEELKQRIESTPVNRNGRAMYSPELKRDVTEYSRATRAESEVSVGAVAAELGLNGWTLQRWHQNERKVPGGASFVEVTAKKRGRPAKATVTEPAPDFEVTCPSGHEVKVPARFEARALRELLAVLEGR